MFLISFISIDTIESAPRCIYFILLYIVYIFTNIPWAYIKLYSAFHFAKFIVGDAIIRMPLIFTRIH